MIQEYQNGKNQSNCFLAFSSTVSLHRFDAIPEVGQNRGLDLILDAHKNLVSPSSVVNSYQVRILFQNFDK